MPPDMPPPPDPAPAPGTVHIKGQILSLHPLENDAGGSLKLKVLEVLQYGSSTPVISSSDSLLIQVTTFPDSLKKGKNYMLHLKHRRVLADFEDNTPRWQLVDIENKTDQK